MDMFLIDITKKNYSIPVCFFILNTQVTGDGECVFSSLLRLPNQVEKSKVGYLDTVNPENTAASSLVKLTHRLN